MLLTSRNRQKYFYQCNKIVLKSLVFEKFGPFFDGSFLLWPVYFIINPFFSANVDCKMNRILQINFHEIPVFDLYVDCKMNRILQINFHKIPVFDL